MKRLIAAAAVLLTAAALGSCGEKAAKPPETVKNFECTAKIEAEGTEYSANMERIDGAGWNVVFTEPAEIEGFEISFMGEQCTLRFKELVQTVERGDLPDCGIADIVCAAADNCIGRKADKTVSKDDVYTESGSVRGYDYTAKIRDGQLEDIEVCGVHAKFEEFKSK